MGCCSLSFLVLPAIILLGGICSEGSLHLQLQGKRRVESNPASVVVKGKLNIPRSRTGEKDVGEIMQIIVKSLIAVGTLSLKALSVQVMVT